MEGITGYWENVPVKGEIPSPRQAVEGVLIENQFLIFGGGPIEGPYSNKVYFLNTENNTWSEVAYLPKGIAPPPRGVMSMVAWKQYVYMFGGYSKKTHLDDFYCFDTVSATWRKIDAKGTIPSPRRGASFVSYKNKLYLFGGSNARGESSFQEIFSFDPETEIWKIELSTGVGSYRHSAVVYNDCMIVHGGDQCRGFSSSTYVYSFKDNSWLQLQTSGQKPLPIEAHKAAIFGKHMVLFGGEHFGAFNEHVFVLNLETREWFDLGKSLAPARIFFAAGTDEKQIILFGGRQDMKDGTTRYYNDVWKFTLSIVTTHEPSFSCALI